MAREFPLGVVLTGTTGLMLCEEGFGAFQEFAEFLTSGPVWTHEFASKPFAEMLKRDLLRQHPTLPTEAPELDATTFRGWVDEQRAIHGDALPCEPIPDYGRTQGPIETLEAMIAARSPEDEETVT